MKHHYSYLALGDSYTIGESVPLHESFPYQVVQILRNTRIVIHAPEIVAKTGWTSFELAEHILHTQLNEQYDFVTLLMGVNNQYRGLSIKDFAEDFDFLLKKAIHFSGEKPAHIMVLSIPDWSVTPFGIKSTRNGISEEINAFNSICASAAKEKGAHFIDITDQTRSVLGKEGLLANDGLHYSAKSHAVWAGKVADIIRSQIHKAQSHM